MAHYLSLLEESSKDEIDNYPINVSEILHAPLPMSGRHTSLLKSCY